MTEITLKPKGKGGLIPPFFITVLVTLCLVINATETHAANENYELGVGDFIRIQVHGENDLTVDARLDEKGRISYPFLGEISVVGITVGRLAKIIDEGLRGDYLIDPEVQVSVLEYRHFYINGAVRVPGGYPYVPGLTVRKATALAGGMTELASDSKIFLIQEKQPDNRVRVNLDDAVGPGDIVVVEEGLF